MNELESLRRLTETVETAKADIAPTYIEYVHLAFAIATDCGEEGRDFFHRLCRVSAKYQREHAERKTCSCAPAIRPLILFNVSSANGDEKSP